MKIGPFEIKLFKDLKQSEMGKELGATGTTVFGGQITGEDYVASLTGTSALTIYDKMRKSDGVVKASLMACELPIRAANWYIEPASDEEADKEVADFVQYNLFEAMTITWDDFLRQALLCLPFGFSVFEKVFQPLDYYGKQMIGWRKFAPRLQKTIFKWQTIDGEDGITQLLNTGEQISIPISKLLIFCHQKEGDNWLGSSVLRSAYRPWFHKQHIENINAQVFERQGLGIPYGKLPKSYSKQDRDKMEELLKNIRANEQAYLLQPEGWEVEFKDMKANTLKDPDETIRRYNREILISVLAQFLDLGSGATGSRALSSDHSSTFHNNLIAIAKTIKDVVNKYAIKQLVDLNFTVKEYPTLEYSYIGLPRYKEIADALSKLVAGKVIRADEKLEGHLRQLMNLPEREEVEIEEDQPKQEPKRDELEEETEELEEEDFKKKTIKKASEFVPFRKLTFAEQKVNFKDIRRKIDEEERNLNKELSETMKKIKSDLIRQFEMVLEAPTNSQKRERIRNIKVKYQEDYRKALYHSIITMFQYGKTISAHEMRKNVPATTAKALSNMSALADSLTEMMADDLIKEGKLALLTELQKKQFNFTEGLGGIMKAISSRAGSIVLNAVAINVASSLNQGRRNSFVAYKDDIYALQRSELLDDRTCNYCMSIDGRTFRKNDSFTKVDLIHSSCRGLWVEIMKTEMEKPKIEGMPKTLRNSFTAVNQFKPPKKPIVRKDSLAYKYLKEEE